MTEQDRGQISYRGKWVLTPDFKISPDAYLVCANGIIQQVTRKRPDGNVVEHDGLILPGLVNAHTHLEFSDLDRPLGEPGEPFVSWIGKVIGHRNSRESAVIYDSITKGLDESANSGTVALGEISTFDWHQKVNSKLDVVDFRELIGFRDEQRGDIEALVKKFSSTEHAIPNRQIGLSPHAPYSINHGSLANAIEWSGLNRYPLAMHLAESREEIELLTEHRGPFYDLLNRLGLWTDANFEKGTRPLAFLRMLACSHRALVIHGNYLDQEELEFMAQNESALRLVYCPRTHAFFKHDLYPLDAILKLGIKLSLGTDSRASNPDLSVWKEMKHIHQHSGIPALEILKMGTIHGAVSLGLEDRFGSLETGKRSCFFLAPVPEDCDLVKELVSS